MFEFLFQCLRIYQKFHNSLWICSLVIIEKCNQFIFDSNSYQTIDNIFKQYEALTAMQWID
jgi:hypothetical protein